MGPNAGRGIPPAHNQAVRLPANCGGGAIANRVASVHRVLALSTQPDDRRICWPMKMTDLTERDAPASQWRSRLLAAMLAEAAVAGWTRSAMDRAGSAAGLSSGQVELAAPRGPIDLLNAFADWADTRMEEKMSLTDLTGMKVRDRVRFAVMARLTAMNPHKAAARRSVATLALPHHAVEAGRLTWRTADRVWRALADPSTDLNYYSKRAMLAAVMVSTELVWAGDEAEDNSATLRFLDRRIANVMDIEKTKARLKPLSALALSAAAVAGRMRYPGRSGT